MKRFAICVGLTKLDPDHYGGWDGNCPGCDRDVARFAEVCHDAGFDGVTALVNAAVTTPGVYGAFSEVCRQLEEGDLLVLYNSGHGGQQRDTDGDEEDRKDETLCWYNGEVVDDQIGQYLCRLAKGTRVLFVSDTCNSGSNYRGIRRRSTPVRLHTEATRKFQGALIHFGGCADGRSSYGADDGGAWTNALLDAMARARKPISYREWFFRAKCRTARPQVPVFAEWGGPSFAEKVALQ